MQTFQQDLVVEGWVVVVLDELYKLQEVESWSLECMTIHCMDSTGMRNENIGATNYLYLTLFIFLLYFIMYIL